MVFCHAFSPNSCKNFPCSLFLLVYSKEKDWYCNIRIYRNRMWDRGWNLTGPAEDSEAGFCQNSNTFLNFIKEGIRPAHQSYLMDSCTHIALRTGNMTLKFSMTCSRLSASSNTSAVMVTRTVKVFSVTSTEYVVYKHELFWDRIGTLIRRNHSI